jgi:hypothetical protein
MQVLNPESFQSWQELKSLVATTSVGQKIDSELILRESGSFCFCICVVKYVDVQVIYR